MTPHGLQVQIGKATTTPSAAQTDKTLIIRGNFVDFASVVLARDVCSGPLEFLSKSGQRISFPPILRAVCLLESHSKVTAFSH